MWSIQSNLVEPFLVIRQSLRPLKLSKWQFAKLLLRQVAPNVSKTTYAMSALSALLICFYIQYRYLSARPVRLPQELPVIQSNATDFENIVKQTQLKVSQIESYMWEVLTTGLT